MDRALSFDRLLDESQRTGFEPADLVDAWVDYAKAAILYPRTNKRVGLLLARLHRVLRSLLGSRPEGIFLRFEEEGAWIGDEFVPYEEQSKIEWLKERAVRCGLHGVRFTLGVSPASLEAFTRTLDENARRPPEEMVFDRIWAGDFPGCEPVERVYEGVFEGGGRGGGALNPATPSGRVLAELIAGSADLRERVRRIETLCRRHAAAAGESPLRSFDLAAEIVGLLPAEAVRDLRRYLPQIRGLLAAVEETLAGPDAPRRGEPLHALMLRLGRKFFSSRDPQGGIEEDRAGRVFERRDAACGNRPARPENDGIDGDFDALLSEVEALPRIDDFRLRQDRQVWLLESLGVHLSFLMTLEDGAALRRIPDSLAVILRDRGIDEKPLLRAFLTAAEQPDVFPYGHRILPVLGRLGLLDRARRCGYLTAAKVEKSFPRFFLAFVGSVDPDDQAARRELAGLCRRLGALRILEAAEELSPAESEAWNTVRGLLAHPDPVYLPLFHLALRAGVSLPAGDLTRWLLAAKFDAPAFEILKVLPRPEVLPREYFLALTGIDGVDGAEKEVAGRAVAALEAFLEMTAFDASMTSRRAYAVNLLRWFPGRRTEALLERILARRKFLCFGREPGVVRRAAREVLSALRQGEDHV